MARDFDGTDDWFNFADVGGANWDGNNPMTIACWTRPDNLGAGVSRNILVQDAVSGATVGWLLQTNSDEPRFQRRGNSPTTISGINLAAGTWCLIAVRVVTNGVNSDLKFVKFSTSGSKTNVNDSDNFNSYAAGDRLSVGAVISGAAHDSYDGVLAHVALWMGEELTDDEVWAYGLNGPRAIGKLPDFYCPLWGVADPEPDLAIGGSGTLNGSASFTDGLVPSGSYAPLPGDAGVA